MSDYSRSRLPLSTIRAYILSQLQPLVAANALLKAVEFSSNDPIELFNYIKSSVPDRGTTAIMHFPGAKKTDEPNTDGAFHIYLVTRSYVSYTTALDNAQNAEDALASSVLSALDNQIYNRQLVFKTTSTVPVVISKGGGCTVVRCEFKFEDHGTPFA